MVRMAVRFELAPLRFVLLCALAPACLGSAGSVGSTTFGTGGPAEGDVGGVSSSTGAATGEADERTSSTRGTSSTSTGAADPLPGGETFDTPEIPDIPIPTSGCTKVDFLFVVDNSGTMGAYQNRLTEALPAFMDAIVNDLELDDFHVIAVDTDPAPVDCLENCDDGWKQCNGATCPALQAQMGCEIELGGGRTIDIEGQPCPIDGPQRFLTEDQTDLPQTFTCIATQGGGNGLERQMQAMVAAVSPSMVEPGGCNDGFLRPDAILVIVVVSDEADATDETPEQWREAIVEAKNGDEEAVVALGVFKDDDSEKMKEFVSSFEYGTNISIDLEDYNEPFITASAAVIEACDDFVPPG